MTSPTYLTWDGDPGNSVAPRRPGLGDVGGATKENDTDPADPVRMLTAEDENQSERQIVALGKVVPACVVSVHFAAGTPSVASFSASGSTLAIGTFTVTDNGTGDTTIAWPVNTFPSPVIDHDAAVTGATGGFAAAQTLTNSARIRTFGTGGAAADLNFNLRIY